MMNQDDIEYESPYQKFLNKRKEEEEKKKEEIDTNDSPNKDYQIKPVQTKKSLIKQCKSAEDGIIPRHPFRLIVNGSSGSGKSVLISNLLSRPEFYKHAFDDIFLFSITCESGLDDTYDGCNIPKENILPPDARYINQIFKLQEKELKHSKDISKLSRILLIFDDCQSYNKFMNSPAFLKSFLMGRHFNCSIIIGSQSFIKTPRSCRINATALMFFKGSTNEVIKIAEDYAAADLNKKQMIKLINDATADKYSFLFIDLNREMECRYKRNLNEVIDVLSYQQQ